MHMHMHMHISCAAKLFFVSSAYAAVFLLRSPSHRALRDDVCVCRPRETGQRLLLLCVHLIACLRHTSDISRHLAQRACDSLSLSLCVHATSSFSRVSDRQYTHQLQLLLLRQGEGRPVIFIYLFSLVSLQAKLISNRGIGLEILRIKT